MLYVYNIDSNEGGDLILHKQHRLDGKKDDSPKGSLKDIADAPPETGTQ